MTELSNEPNGSAQPARKRKSRSFLGSVIWGVAVFAVLLAGFAAFTNTSKASVVLPLRSIGSFHAQFELKWFALQKYAAEHGGVDVVILGNSMVNTGIDPTAFENSYRNLSGQDLRVFNFGVEGLTVEPLSKLAKLIEDTYHPGTIILFTEMRDYIASNGVEASQQFLGSSWMRYQTGNSSVEGFLVDHFAFLDTLLPFRNWSSSTFLDTYRFAIYRQRNLTPEGYEREASISFKPFVPDPTNPEDWIKYQQAANFTVDPRRIQDLLDIIALQNQDLRVYVTEIPLYPTYFIYFGSTEIREQYLDQISSIVNQAGSIYIPALDESLIPLYGRADDHHLNFQGEPIFSRLLAQQFYTACKDKGACLAPASNVSQP